MGVLGDKVFDISPGTPRYRILQEGDTLPVASSVDFETVVQMASGAVTEVVGLTNDLKKITGGINRGEGTFGQLVTNRALYDQLNSTLARTSSLMMALENPRGTIGRLLNDPALYYSLNRAIASADTVISQIGKIVFAYRPARLKPARPHARHEERQVMPREIVPVAVEVAKDHVKGAVGVRLARRFVLERGVRGLPDPGIQPRPH